MLIVTTNAIDMLLYSSQVFVVSLLVPNVTRVTVLEYGWSVQVVTRALSTNHLIHVHEFSFYVLGSGIGNYNPATAKLNLVDPHYRNTGFGSCV